LAKLAFANMQDFTIVDKNGQPILDLSSITRDQFAAIQEIREDATGGAGDGERRKVLRTTVKLANKTQNLELLGKHLGLFPTKVDLGAVDPDGKPMAIRIEMVSASRG
jgi:phage terminase small subunit